MADLIVYGEPLSPFARKVQAVLHARQLFADDLAIALDQTLTAEH